MENVQNILRWLFTYIFYPLIILAIFWNIIYSIIRLLEQATPRGRIRRVTAALLPFVMFVFLVSFETDRGSRIGAAIDFIPPLLRFIIGAVIGLAVMESGVRFRTKDAEMQVSLLVFLESLIGVFILYCIMTGYLGSIQLFLLGLILAAGFHVMLRGFGRKKRVEEKTEIEIDK